MHNGLPSTHTQLLSGLEMLVHGISQHRPNPKQKSDFYCHILVIKFKFIYHLTNENPENKGQFFFSPSNCQTIFPPVKHSLSTLSTPTTASTNTTGGKKCTKWLHTLTWLNDVWSGVTPSTSPIPRTTVYLPSARTLTHRFPFPELCFQNRSFILTVNSQADRYSLSILFITVKKLSGLVPSLG